MAYTNAIASVSVFMLIHAAPHQVCSETLTSRVVGISDGDTLTALVSHQQVKVRLADIDAPERRS